MHVWLFLIFTMLVQESVSLSAAIFQAREAGISWPVIHIIWLIATVIDLVVPYYLGKMIFNRRGTNKTKTAIGGWGGKARRFLIKRGEFWGLLLLGFINFVYINGFIAAWLKINIKKAMALFFIGDLISYLGLLGINLGGSGLFQNKVLSFVVIMSVVFLISALIEVFVIKQGKYKLQLFSKKVK